MTTKEIYGPWIKWHGGECPVPPDTMVNVNMRNGTMREPRRAADFRWEHHGGGYDIVQFCTVTEQAKLDLEAAEQLLRANDYTIIPPAKQLTCAGETCQRRNQMTAPRPNSELATLYFSDSTLKCWARERGCNDKWSLLRYPAFNSSYLDYYVGHEPPPPNKRTITLNVNGKEWVLPAPMADDAQRRFYYISEANSAQAGFEDGVCYDNLRAHIKMNGGSVYATEADAQAWADFFKWCRGGGA